MLSVMVPKILVFLAGSHILLFPVVRQCCFKFQTLSLSLMWSRKLARTFAD